MIPFKEKMHPTTDPKLIQRYSDEMDRRYKEVVGLEIHYFFNRGEIDFAFYIETKYRIHGFVRIMDMEINIKNSIRYIEKSIFSATDRIKEDTRLYDCPRKYRNRVYPQENDLHRQCTLRRELFDSIQSNPLYQEIRFTKKMVKKKGVARGCNDKTLHICRLMMDFFCDYELRIHFLKSIVYDSYYMRFSYNIDKKKERVLEQARDVIMIEDDESEKEINVF